MSRHYDAVMVLGSKPDTANWQFPSHVYKSLALAADMYAHGQAPRIIVSGKWALSFDHHNIRQPFAECDKMAEYLVECGVPPRDILREGQSKDTIANLYFVKHLYLEPLGLHNILCITADFRKERVAYLCDKMLGPDFSWSIATVPAEPEEVYPSEAETLARTKQFLAHMRPGQDAFLGEAFYDAPYYRDTLHKK